MDSKHFFEDMSNTQLGIEKKGFEDKRMIKKKKIL